MEPRRVDPIRQHTPVFGAKRREIQATYDQLNQEIRELDRQLRDLSKRREAAAAKRRAAHRQLFTNLAKRGRRALPDGSESLPPVHANATRLWGRRLRAACREILQRRGPTSLTEIHAQLHRQGYVIEHQHPVKALADALGYETDQGRAKRNQRGTYELIAA